VTSLITWSTGDNLSLRHVLTQKAVTATNARLKQVLFFMRLIRLVSLAAYCRTD